MSKINKPNTNQATDGELSGKMRDVLEKWLKGQVDDMLPARVISYNDASNRAVIQPIVMIGTTSGQKVSRGRLQNIPVFRYGGGGFFMRFPIKPGDFGWLKANDRDISLILQSNGGEDWPNTKRAHSFSDAMFFPDTVREWIISGGNSDAFVLQSMDGAVCLSLHNNKIMMRGDVEVLGDFSVTGSVEFNGPSLTHNGKDVGDTHVHSGVEPGSGQSGPPV